MSWGVRRIEDESTDPVHRGDRRSAMTVGEWLDTVAAAPRGRSGVAAEPARTEATHESQSIETLDRKLEELNLRLKRLSSNPKGASREPAADRTGEQTARKKVARDRPSGERDVVRAPETDQVAARLEQIDRRLAELTRAPRVDEPEPDTFERTRSAYRTHADRLETQQTSDAERLRQGLREIERLQATLFEGLTERQGRSGQAIERHMQETNRVISPVAETIARLEAEVRGLRQTVENRLEPAQAPFDDTDLQEMRRMLQRIAEAGTGRQESVQIERLFDEMNRLRDLVVETGTKTISVNSAKSAQEARLADMVERLASVATSAQEKTSDDMRLLERRLGDVADRMADLEVRGGTAKDIAELQRAINTIATKLDRPVTPVFPPSLLDLDLRIDRLNEKLDRPQAAAKPVIPAGLIDLDIRIERLSEKLDRVEPHPANSRQMATLESEIAALRLDLAQTISTRGTSTLEKQISALGDRIDRLAAAPATTPGVNFAAFETRIGDLVGRLDRIAHSETTLDKHVDALQGEVAALRRDLAKLGAPQRNAALEDQIRLIAERLDRAGGQNPDPRVLGKIDDKINHLAELVSAERRRASEPNPLEIKLAKIEQLLAERRDDALEAASAAAREAVREFAEFAADTRQSDTSVRALEDDVRRMQEATRSNETRTSDALQSVHDALTTIVSRLGSIERTAPDRVGTAIPERETIARDATESGSLSPNRPAAPQMPFDDLPTQPRAPVRPDVQQTAPTQPLSAAPRAPEAIAQAPEDHRPLEPGSGKPRSAPSQAPASARGPQAAPVAQAQRPAAAPTYPQTAAAPQDGDAGGPKRNDFIAAARRAALAASQSGPDAPPPIPGDRSRASTAQPETETAPKASKSLFAALFKSKQKTLILAGVGIAAASTGIAFVAASALRAPSVDAMPTASLSRPLPSQTPRAAPSPEASAAALALAPPSPVTSTFSTAPLPTDDANRQALLSDAMKQAALAQGVRQSPAVKLADTTGSAQRPGPATGAQQMPPPIGATLSDTAPADTTQSAQPATQAASDAIPLASDKVGSLALRTAAASGDAKAQFEVAMRYSEGRGLAPDLHEAATWFERAAARGFGPAAYRLGSAYEKGLGLDRNPVEAKRWYRQAAENGNVRAMHNLGVLYANDRDMPSALPWFQKAAEAGLKDSQFNLGIIYALGSGVKQDLGISYKWFALGAAQGDQEAAKKRDDIATHLDHTALAGAKLAVSTWHPVPISREANEETAVWSEPATTGSIKPSANGTSVAAPAPPPGWNKTMQVQAALQGKGLYAGKIDGELTPETKAAIRVFQKKAGLKQSGDIDNALLNAVVAKQM